MPAQPDDNALLSSYLSAPPGERDAENPLLVSYLSLRRAVGLIGILLPFVLAIGKLLLQGPGLQSSVSSYYYTTMRDVFVGSLCAIAVFLWSYKGYDRRDDRAGNIASAAAVGVALFPTTPDLDPTPRAQIVGAAHLLCALVFFLTLAYFCLRLFTQTDQRHPSARKRQRNLVYTVCGYTILACVALIPGAWFLIAGTAVGLRLAPVFWLEALAIVAFGVSWLTKGEAILKDREPRAARPVLPRGSLPF